MLGEKSDLEGIFRCNRIALKLTRSSSGDDDSTGHMGQGENDCFIKRAG
jgi:hypothetical protein